MIHVLQDNQEKHTKKYNLMLVWTPDTEQRIKMIQTHLFDTLGEQVDVEIIPFKLFKDNSPDPELLQSARGKHVYVYADVESNYVASNAGYLDPSSRYMFTRGILNILSNYWAKTINVIFPNYPYARSDKWEKIWAESTQKRKPLYAQIVASDMKAHGVDYVITLDIHNTATLALYWWEWKWGVKPINIPHSWVIQKAVHMNNLQDKDYEMGSTDEGGTTKIQKLAEDLSKNHYIAIKARDNRIANTVSKLEIYPWAAELTGKDIVVYDDMIDTWWTLVSAVEKLHIYSPHSIIVVASHGLFNWDAIQKLQKLYDDKKIEKVYITDSVYRENLPSCIEIIGTDEIIARQIARKAKWLSLDPNYTWPLLSQQEESIW